MGNNFGSVQRRSEHQIEHLAAMVRRELGVQPGERLAMRPVLELALDDMVEDAYWKIELDAEMGGAEASTAWHEPVITVSASTYAELCRSNPRARMTIAHEIGHLLMHTRKPVFHYRTRTKDQRLDPEWQADYFAAALLMPATAFRKMKTVTQAMKAFGVSRGAALRRARGLRMQISDDRARSSSEKKGRSMNRAP
jgi:hypothetical protein